MKLLHILLSGILLSGIFGFSQVNTGTISVDCIEGNEKEKTENRKTSPFNGLHVDGAFNVLAVCGQKQKITVTGDSNIVPHIVTKVRNDILFLTAKKSICSKIPVTIRISIENIQSVTTSGANDIVVSNINNSKIKFDGDGSGDTTLSGRTNLLTASLKGSLNLHAKNLIADEVRITAADSTEAVIHAAMTLSAASRDVGEIVYYGNPSKITKEENDIGEIIAR